MVSSSLSSPEAPWGVAVRHYVRIAELNDYEEESQLLADLRNQGLSRTDLVNAPIALAQDIEDHFQTPNRFWPYKRLLVLYKAAESAWNRSRFLSLLGATGGGRAEELFRDLLANDETAPAPVSFFFYQRKDSATVQFVAQVFFSGTNRSRSAGILRNIASPADSQLMLEVLGKTDQEEADILASWFCSHPLAEDEDYEYIH